jgi:hypothetical protein
MLAGKSFERLELKFKACARSLMVADARQNDMKKQMFRMRPSFYTLHDYFLLDGLNELQCVVKERKLNSVLQCMAACCSELQYVAVCCSLMLSSFQRKASLSVRLRIYFPSRTCVWITT